MQRDLEQSTTLARVLRALPDEANPPYGWSEFRRRAAQRAGAPRGTAAGRSLVALAVIAAGIAALSVRLGERQRTALPADAGAAAARAGSVGFGTLDAAERARSEARSEMLERWLASQPDEPALVQVGNRAAVTALEDRLAEVDDLLTAERVVEAQAANLLALQRERQRLVSSLAQVRYAETLADATR